MDTYREDLRHLVVLDCSLCETHRRLVITQRPGSDAYRYEMREWTTHARICH